MLHLPLDIEFMTEDKDIIPTNFYSASNDTTNYYKEINKPLPDVVLINDILKVK